MKLKRDIMIIALIIAVLFTVSSVCAADSEIQTISAHNSTDTVSAVNDNSLKMNDGDEILAEMADFADLNETINGDPSKTYIELETDYRGSFEWSNGIQINRGNITIDGKGHTIDCIGQNSRMFNIQKEAITLKNIKFTGGSSDRGGAIYTNKDLTIINCTFESNQATGNDGGAIFADDVKMSIYNCTFVNNIASSNGGAVAGMGQAPDDWEIFNCTFIDNSAGDSGGALYLLADQNMGNIINSTFIGNRARAGDAVYNYGYKGTIDRCVFVNNTANSMIYALYADPMIVNNSIIVNNYGDTLVDAQESIIDNNWWGTTVDDTEAPVVSGTTLDTYYVLDMTVDDDSADITLNNLHDNGVLFTSYANYALPSINFTVKGRNVEVPDYVVLGTSGEATIEHSPSAAYAITIEYNGVELTREIIPSFKRLKDKISESSEISLEQDYIYDSTKDYVLTNGIEFAKDMTIDGQGYIIDARQSTNIFYFDDDTNSYSLTLKNIVFANATGVNGAAVYFKGNKLEIINCTFINNTADSEGDVVYVANALSNANKIEKSAFIENTGTNSLLYLNLDSNADLTLTDSIFASNDAAYNVIGTENVVLEHNWMGSTDENNNLSKIKNVTVKNWLFLKIDAVPAMNGNATISLNNVYENGEISTYDEYALHPITFSLGGINATSSVPAITLGDNGQANYQFRMDRATATLTASHGEVAATKKVKYSVVDDGSFRALNEIIFFSEDGDVIELTHDYIYSDNDTITDGIVIPRKITINGNGHTLDAKGKTRIFMVPEGVSQITVNNISFINAKASYGSVIVINVGSNYFNFSNCNFTDNVATDYGGVMDCVGDYCTIDNCNFVNNCAVSKAGVIRYYHNNLAYIKNSNFANNRVADGSSGGGAIFVDDGAVVIDRSTFINNVANDRQGSVLYTLRQATITNSIFLNNPGESTVYGANVSIADNWFGNNATDYNNLSNTVNRASGTWLFLNATVDSNSIPESWPADISFRLYSYNATSGNVSEYGGDFFDNIELTVTAENGRTDKSPVNLNEVFSYIPSVAGKGSVTATVENVFCTVPFEIYNREDSQLLVESQNVTYGSKIIIAIDYNASSTGKVNITLKGKNNNYALLDRDLNRQFAFEEIIKPDVYDVTVAYSGDAVFSNATANATLTVNKLKSDIKITSYEIYFNETQGLMFKVTLPDNATGDLIFSYGKVTGTMNVVKNGNAASVIDFKNNALAVGKYNGTFTYSGDDIYEGSSASAISSIIIVETEIIPANATIEMLANGESKINYVLKPANAVGEVTFTSNSDVIEVNPNTGVIKALKQGNATVTITFSGCENYTASSASVRVSVSKAPTEISLENSEITLNVGQSVSTGASLIPAEAGNLTYAISNSSVVKVENGKIVAISEGTASIVVSFKGNEKYTAAEKTIAVNVHPKKVDKMDPGVSVTVSDVNVGENVVVDVSINENATGKVSLTLNNKYYENDISNGKASFSISDLNAGTYSVLVRFAGDDNFNASEKTASFKVIESDVPVNGTNTTGNNSSSGNVSDSNATGNNSSSGNTSDSNATGNGTVVAKLNPDLSVSISDVNVGEDVIVDVLINEDATGNVTLTFNNVESIVDISNGKGSFIILNLAAGDYSVLVSFGGDQNYLAANKTVSFKVIASQTPVDDNNTAGNASGSNATGNGTVIAKLNPDLSVSISDVNVGENAVVNVFINQNATGRVTLTFNDVESVVSISDGKGSFTILNLAAGDYSVIVKFKGDENFKEDSKTASFKVIASQTPVDDNNTTGNNSTSGNATGGNDNGNNSSSGDVSGGNATGNNSSSGNVDGGNATGNVTGGNATGNNSTSGNATGGNATGNATDSNATGNQTNVTKSNPELTVRVSDITVGEKATVNVEINPNATGKVTVDGKEVTVTDGKATLTLEGLAVGEYTVTVQFDGDSYFNADKKAATFKVGKIVKPAEENPFNVDENKTVESKTPTYSIELPSDATGNLTVTIANKTYVAEVINGTAKIKVTDMPVGNYNVTIEYSGDEKYAPIIQNSTARVVVDPKVVMSQSSVSYTARYKVTVYGDDGKVAAGKSVVFYIDGKKVKTVKTNSKGIATFVMPSKYLPNKKYTIKAVALTKSASKKVTVKQTLSIKKVKVKKSAKSLILTATLKKVDGKSVKGKLITFKFNGKTCKAKANSKGVAKVTIKKSVLKKLKVGKKVTYQAKYLKNIVKKTVKVQK